MATGSAGGVAGLGGAGSGADWWVHGQVVCLEAGESEG